MARKILLAVDINNEEANKAPLAAALDLAHDGGVLHVVSVLPDFGFAQVSQYFPEGYEHKMIDEFTHSLAAWVKSHVPEGVEAHPHVAHGTIYDEVVKAGDKLGVDVIVIGSHRHALRDYLVGPNAERVVRHSNRSVYVARS
ncbi:Universal stress protein UP12 [Defluviimonas aquaemixtae]|uniref:Universal stress protein UP12 n=1 Tax=Albidovulum aquaemixtae TaxID=1542388 RepID=A0A2R8BM78_9RHOB|nr:universal stress protein [Defluviimonas aquaemixtae]SPH24440.1 Universal stress protein UP12 [Defluviimonas aquaemixtae]